MKMLEFFDYQTLLICEFFVAVTFTAVFYVIHRLNPQARGSFTAALSFLLLGLETVAVRFDGNLSIVWRTFLGAMLMLGSMIAMYEAVLQFTRSIGRRWLLWFLTFASFPVVYYNTEIYPNLVPCLIAITLVASVIRSFTALALFQRTKRSTQVNVLIVFGTLVAVVALFHALSVGLLSDQPASLSLGNVGPIAALMRGVEMLGAAICGIGFLILTNHELVSYHRTEKHRDPITGLITREGLEISIAIELERGSSSQQVFSIALTKINELNTVLENGGTEATDALRLEVAAVFARQLRSSDMFGRFAGDLYLLVLPQATHEEALMIADRIAAEAANLRVLATAQPITLSIGITEAVAGDTFSTLLSRADTALFQATADVKSRRRAVLAPGSTTSKSQDQEVVAR